MHNLIVITGPPGAGKTTIANLLAKELRISTLRGDDVKEELYPGLEDISQHPHELAIVKAELLKRATEIFNMDQNVMVDYIVLGEYIREYQRTFGKALIMKVLLPSVEVTTLRDAKRSCWTAGKKHIEQLWKDFREDESLIGSQNYIDNSHEPPEQTAKNIAEHLTNNAGSA